MDVVVERVTIGATPTDTRAGLERLLDGATGSEGGAPQISLHVAVAQVEGLVEHDVLITFMRSYIDIPEHERVDVVWEATTGGPMPFPGLTGRLQLTPEAAGTLLTVAGSPARVAGWIRDDDEPADDRLARDSHRSHARRVCTSRSGVDCEDARNFIDVRHRTRSCTTIVPACARVCHSYWPERC